MLALGLALGFMAGLAFYTLALVWAGFFTAPPGRPK